MSEPVATVKAYRRTGGAVVTVERRGRLRRYVVSLRRYAWLREWTVTRGAGFGRPGCWRTSGAWMRNSLTVYLWSQST